MVRRHAGDVDYVHVFFPDSFTGGLCLCPCTFQWFSPRRQSYLHSALIFRHAGIACASGSDLGNSDYPQPELEADQR